MIQKIICGSLFLTLMGIISIPVTASQKVSSEFDFDNSGTGAGNGNDSPFKEDMEKLSRTFDWGPSAPSSGGNFINKRLYNTSVAMTASMFSYYLPSRTQPGTVTDVVNQAIYGLFATFAICLIFAVPVLLTGVMLNNDAKRKKRNAGDVDGDENSNEWIKSPIMKIENVKHIFDEEYRDEIGLDYEKCLQKTICEAHRSPKNKNYGLLALPFQIFYPPPEKESTSSARATSTSFQMAAANGKFTKESCSMKYKCFFDTLDLATFLIDWYRLSNNDLEYVPSEPESF